MDGNKTPYTHTHTQKPLKVKSFEKKLHLGFLGFLLGDAKSANPATLVLDDTVLELIIEKIKKKYFFFPFSVSLKSKKQNKPTNPHSEFDSKSKPWNFREREQRGIGQFGCCCCYCFELGICFFVV